MTNSAFDDFSEEVVEQFLGGGEGVAIEEETGRVIGYSVVPEQHVIALVAADDSRLSNHMSDLERSSLVQLAVSLFIISVAGGAAIWIAELVGQTPPIFKRGEKDAAIPQEMWETVSAGKIWRGRFANWKKDNTLCTLTC